MRYFKRTVSAKRSPQPKLPPVVASDFPVHVFHEKLDEDRTILRYMFPVDGEVKDLVVFVGKSPDAKPRIGIRTFTKDGNNEFFVDVKQGKNNISELITFKASDRVVVSMDGNTPGYEEIWISFLYRGNK